MLALSNSRDALFLLYFPFHNTKSIAFHSGRGLYLLILAEARWQSSNWPCCCPGKLWEPIRKRAHTQLVRKHSVTVISACGAAVAVDWSWHKEWNLCARANLHLKKKKKKKRKEKKKTARAGNEWSNILPKSSQARMDPTPSSMGPWTQRHHQWEPWTQRHHQWEPQSMQTFCISFKNTLYMNCSQAPLTRQVETNKQPIRLHQRQSAVAGEIRLTVWSSHTKVNGLTANQTASR